MLLRGLFLCLCLAACTPGANVITHRDDWTGMVEFYTPEHEIYRGNKAVMVVRPVVVQDGTDRIFGLLTNIRTRGPNAPIVTAMYSGDIKLQYQFHDRLRSHCIDGCQRAELGVIHLTEAAFRTAARTGLPIRVFGRRGRYEGDVPGVLFQRVLDTL